MTKLSYAIVRLETSLLPIILDPLEAHLDPEPLQCRGRSRNFKRVGGGGGGAEFSSKRGATYSRAICIAITVDWEIVKIFSSLTLPTKIKHMNIFQFKYFDSKM